jgi:hypothetical protein
MKSIGMPLVELYSILDNCVKKIDVLANRRDEPRRRITSPKLGGGVDEEGSSNFIG